MRKPKKGSPIGGARAWDERSMVGGAFI
jgi:hypothetical protein